MRTDSTETTNPDRAIEALAWAAAAATTVPDDLGPQPPRPTPAELRSVPVATLREALDQLLLGRQVETGLEGLQTLGVLDAWLPEVAAMVGFGDGEWRHKDVWKHTKQVVWQSVPRLEVRWGALLHDIGKPRTRKIEPNGEVHFYGHAEVGAAMFRKRIADRLGFDGELYDRVHFLVLHHLRASQYDGSWTDSAVRRFTREMGVGLRDLLDLSRADITTKRPHRRKQGLRMISELSARIEKVRAEDARVPPLPKGLGHAIMDAFDVPPSRQLGDLMKALAARCEAGSLEPQRDAAYYIAWIAEHREELGL